MPNTVERPPVQIEIEAHEKKFEYNDPRNLKELHLFQKKACTLKTTRSQDVESVHFMLHEGTDLEYKLRVLQTVKDQGEDAIISSLTLSEWDKAASFVVHPSS